MEKVLRGLFNLKEVKLRYDDDIYDRLSRRYSVSLLICFCIVVTTTQYVGSPIQCWCPAHFTDSHKSYTNTICWVHNTYYVPWDESVPEDHVAKEMVSYYQWVPFILLCQALLCYFPSMLWKFMCRRSGLNVAGVIDAAIAGQRTSYSDMRDKATRYVVFQIDRYLSARLDKRRGCWAACKQFLAKYCCLVYGKFYGNYLTISYLMCKTLYLINAIGQLMLLDFFLDTDFHLYGIDVMLRLVTGRDWTKSERFPRVTLCNFQIRHQGTQFHKYIVQCVLPINLFNEKIFIFIWFWLVGLAICTAYSLLKWSIKTIFWQYQVSYIKRCLNSMNAFKGQREALVQFTTKYLRRDGVFLVRLLSNNVGSLATAEVVGGLWDNYGPDRRYGGGGRDPELGMGGAAQPSRVAPSAPIVPPRDSPRGLVKRVAQQMRARHRNDSI
jgi:hypothetical protein